MLTQVMTHVFVFMLMYCDDIKYTFTDNGIFVCFKAVIIYFCSLQSPFVILWYNYSWIVHDAYQNWLQLVDVIRNKVFVNIL